MKNIRISHSFKLHYRSILSLIFMVGITLSQSASGESLQELVNNKARVVFGDSEETLDFQIVIPAGGTQALEVSMKYLSGSSDLLFSETPTFKGAIKCPYVRSRWPKIRRCELGEKPEGTYYVRVTGSKYSFFGILTASYSSSPSSTELEAGIWYTPSGVAEGEYRYTVTLT